MNSLHSTWSRKSDASCTSSSMTLSQLFDFLATHIIGLFKVTSKHFILEYKEDNRTANLTLRLYKTNIYAELVHGKIRRFGIDYNAYVKILHENGEEFFILIPECRSYNPAGTDRPYITFNQYMFITKLVAVEVRAATLGIPENQIDDIFDCIQKASQVYATIKEVCEWIHLQIKCACYLRIQGPNFYELLLNKASLSEFDLNIRDHCKEYLENCLDGSEVSLPRLYYKVVLENEPRLQFDKKVLFAEIIRRESNKSKAVLYHLPKAVPHMVYVKQGKNYTQIVNDIEKFYAGHNSVENMAACCVM